MARKPSRAARLLVSLSWPGLCLIILRVRSYRCGEECEEIRLLQTVWWTRSLHVAVRFLRTNTTSTSNALLENYSHFFKESLNFPTKVAGRPSEGLSRGKRQLPKNLPASTRGGTFFTAAVPELALLPIFHG